jgi:hypothetical protein
MNGTPAAFWYLHVRSKWSFGGPCDQNGQNGLKFMINKLRIKQSLYALFNRQEIDIHSVFVVQAGEICFHLISANLALVSIRVLLL